MMITFFLLKVKIRQDLLCEKNTNILECFAGDGKIYDAIKSDNVTLFKIDANEKFNVDYHGNCLEYIKNNDISKFNIIDLDSWGSPAKYIELLKHKKYKGIVVCTYCSPVLMNPCKIICSNYYGRIYENTKRKTILNKDIGKMFRKYLIDSGFTEIKGYFTNKKVYCSFKIG